MKKMLRGIVFAVITVSLVFGLFACAKDDPVSLAKESFDIAEQMKANPFKIAELVKKQEAIAAKVAKMSVADQAKFSEEIAKYAQELLRNFTQEDMDVLQNLADEMGRN